jgi:hypothetical protein
MLDPSSFAYDQQAPLALEVKAERAQDGAMVRDITYASPHGGKVPAYLSESLHLAQPSQELVQLLEQVPSPTPLES